MHVRAECDEAAGLHKAVRQTVCNARRITEVHGRRRFGAGMGPPRGDGGRPPNGPTGGGAPCPPAVHDMAVARRRKTRKPWFSMQQSAGFIPALLFFSRLHVPGTYVQTKSLPTGRDTRRVACLHKKKKSHRRNGRHHAGDPSLPPNGPRPPSAQAQHTPYPDTHSTRNIDNMRYPVTEGKGPAPPRV